MLRKLFSRKRKLTDEQLSLSYEDQRQQIQNADASVRLDLASRTDARPEILYYLAEDDSPDVRRAIAANKSTPAQADALLAKDVDDEVRCDLALKIARLVPDMPADEQDRVREQAIEVLDLLAQDQLPRVRAILSEQLKTAGNVPKNVITRLAKDVELIVSAPVLEYSPLLNDADLLEIIAAGTAQGAMTAIARRNDVGADVADAVVASLDVPAVAALLTNKGAQIREETLDKIIDNAAQVDSWHEPLVMRPELSMRAVRRIAGFVASSLVSILAERNDLDDHTAAELAEAVKKRLDQTGGEVGAADEARARELFKSGTLDDDTISGAIDVGQIDFVVHALSLRGQVSLESVRKLLNSGSAKAITALSWKAGLSMRTAMRLQSKAGKVPPNKMLYARNGTDYPMSEEDMKWQLDAFA